ncbi:hypothetical protein QU668_04015 [Schaalia sp. HMT-877]|nr:hypothetical protein HMPREF1550_00846 [Actinomyces sp. oral taxon 877 str. F0543]WLD80913.1 hypothetical protein QU668_04015 [Schaalia sp. HMT-877]
MSVLGLELVTATLVVVSAVASMLTVSALMRDAGRPRPGAQHRGRR